MGIRILSEPRFCSKADLLATSSWTSGTFTLERRRAKGSSNRALACCGYCRRQKEMLHHWSLARCTPPQLMNCDRGRSWRDNSTTDLPRQIIRSSIPNGHHAIGVGHDILERRRPRRQAPPPGYHQTRIKQLGQVEHVHHAGKEPLAATLQAKRLDIINLFEPRTKTQGLAITDHGVDTKTCVQAIADQRRNAPNFTGERLQQRRSISASG